MPTTCRAWKKGFTLIELMICLAIIGILGLISVPAFGEFIPKYRLDGAVRALVNEMQLARTQAASRNLQVRLTFNEGDQAIYVAEIDGATTTIVKTLTFDVSDSKFPGVRLGRNSIAAAIPESPTGNASPTDAAMFGSTSSYSNTALFLPNGLLESSGEFFLIYGPDRGTSRNDRTRAIQVFRAGMVKKWRYNGAAWEAY
jgi:prepilin-type N-terminal cleavage/methylation domain-containing protein